MSEIMTDSNGKKYVRVYSGRVLKGYQYMGNKELSPSYGTDEWTECGHDEDVLIQDMHTLIFRKPMFDWHEERKKLNEKKTKNGFDWEGESDTIKHEEKKVEDDLKSYSIEDLMKWRNTASKRMDGMDKELELIDIVLKEYIATKAKILKKRAKDARWVSRLNHSLFQKVIKERN